MAEAHGDPRLVTCPICNAQPGAPCTEPNHRGRYPVRWFHLAREAAARKESS